MVAKRVAACGVGLSLLFSACSTQAVKPATPAIPTPDFVAWSQKGVPAKRVCVLPFTDRTETAGLATQVRESFAGHLSIKRFSDAELHEIDTRLSTISGDWKTQSAQRLGKPLQCDALIYGEVTTAERLYLGLYSQLTLEGWIRVVDSSSGQSLVAGSYATKFRSGAFPFSALGVVPGAVLNLRNITDAQLIRAIDDLGRHLAEKVPDLSVTSPVPHVAQPVPSSPAQIPSIGGDAQQAPSRVEQERYQVQVAAFRTSAAAQQAARLLRDRGYRPAIAESNGPSPARHRVVVGPFPSIHEAQQVGAQIEKILRVTPMVVQTNGSLEPSERN